MNKIAKTVEGILKDSKIGTAYERYDISHLWDLGEQIREYSTIAADKSDITAEVINYLEHHSTRCVPLLLKNAETARRVWPRREEFLDFVRGVSYGKFREVLPVFDPGFVSQHRVSKEDLDGLRSILPESTYERVREHVGRLRDKYDPSRMSMDFDTFYQDLYSATVRLKGIVERSDAKALEEFRKSFTPKFIEDSRRLLAAMKNEETFSKIAKQLAKGFGQDLNTKDENLEADLDKVIYQLSRIRTAPVVLRQTLRERIGIARLGELSTLMKAASSDEEMEQYLRSQKLLRQMRVPEVAG